VDSLCISWFSLDKTPWKNDYVKEMVTLEKQVRYSFSLYKLIVVATVVLFAVGETLANDAKPGHEVYRVTYYDLGTLLTPDESKLLPSIQSVPLMIMGSTADIFTNENLGLGSFSYQDEKNPLGMVLSAEFAPTETIRIIGSFGMAKSPGSIDFSTENQSAWEANVGLAYTFFGNLSYQMSLGYMDTGDLFTERSSFSDVEQILMISNSISLSF
jgi:hypothetical protein